MMTRKDYVSVAKILNDAINGVLDSEEEVIQAFVEMFEADNPNFDADKFVEAVNA
jgi:hypothetical protein